MRVGADDGVGIGGAVGVGEDDAAQVLEVDLVADPGTWGYDADVREGLLSPAQEAVALRVAFVLEGCVHLEGVAAGIGVNDDGMVDHEVDGHERIDPSCVAAERPDGVAHGGEVDDARHAGEILEEDARRRVRDLPRRPAGLVAGQSLHVLGLHAYAVLVAKQVLEQELDGIGDSPQVSHSLESRQTMDLVTPVTDVQGAPGVETVPSGHLLCLPACTLGSGGEVLGGDHGRSGVDTVVELAKGGGQGKLFVRA